MTSKITPAERAEIDQERAAAAEVLDATIRILRDMIADRPEFDDEHWERLVYADLRRGGETAVALGALAIVRLARLLEEADRA